MSGAIGKFTMLLFILAARTSGSEAAELRVLKALPGGLHKEIDTKLIGDQIFFEISHLEANANYRADLWLNSTNKFMHSWASFTANSNGVIRTLDQVPDAGTYDVPHADGIFWSLAPSSIPPLFGVPQENYCLDVTREGAEVARKCFSLAFVSPDTKVRDLNILEHGFIGKLLVPREPRSRMIVVTVSGSEGGLFSSYLSSAFLANQGIPSLAVAYFGVPGLPDQLNRIPLEYFESVFAFIRNKTNIDADRIILLGPSRGSELSLLLASHYPEVTGVVSFVTGLATWAGNTLSCDSPAWTWQGEDVGFLRPVGALDESIDYHGNPSFSNRGAFERGYQRVPVRERPYIPVEKINGPVLFIGGSDDQVWPSCEFGAEALRRMKSFGHKFEDRFICMQDAGHDSAVPGKSTYARSMAHPHMGVTLNFGGTPKGAGIGLRHAWSQVLQFISEIDQSRSKN